MSGDVTKPTSIESIKPIGEEKEGLQEKKSFEPFLKEEAAAEKTQTGSKLSPMDLPAAHSIKGTEPTTSTILGQIQDMQDKIGGMEKNLKAPEMKLKKDHQNLIDKKLSDALSHVESAAKRLGVPVESLSKEALAKENPIARFLTTLTHGQVTLNSVAESLQKTAKSGKPLTPAETMLVQVKLSQAQQDIEFSSIIVTKIIDSIRQTMSIQI